MSQIDDLRNLFCGRRVQIKLGDGEILECYLDSITSVGREYFLVLKQDGRMIKATIVNEIQAL